jgi:hypothetical protein
MRLIRRRSAVDPRRSFVAVVWRTEEVPPEREPGVGEHVAFDLVRYSFGVRPEGEAAWRWGLAGRVTDDPRDLGRVFDGSNGAEIGVVSAVLRDGKLLDWAVTAARAVSG